MLTSKTKYALIALHYLGRHHGKGPVHIRDLARDESIPAKYLERILVDMKRAGILQSRKGKGGGYALRRRPEDIPLSEVVRLMDGPLAPVSCVSETAYAPCRECRDEKACAIRPIMKEIRDAIAHKLEQTSLADMLANKRSRRRK